MIVRWLNYRNRKRAYYYENKIRISESYFSCNDIDILDTQISRKVTITINLKIKRG